MKHNISEVADLLPHYLGFIFYPGSPRNFLGEIPNLPDSINKVGVFVNTDIEHLVQLVSVYDLDTVQLHGEETTEYCEQLGKSLEDDGLGDISLWKVFHIKDEFNFNLLKSYEPFVEAFLFDTKGKTKGGTGEVFNWNALEAYPSEKPFMLSGGIGLEEINEIKKMLSTDLPILGVDVNSRFEIEPGRKDIIKLKKFIDELSCK
ncbi:phosphoribosylanthranilate isomerase [Aureitalea sp. L0-47]|uniref:phosphoribosylanthranilate isomerase n=1 Tax=Aureitalea sp. L0-47 TaxID=2816962 RepID=UPI0022383FF2|nr:phosphoribosylanthranilate isomerase [Aureitalea sp. L0-47]MCW5520736.1 phosphoribosylanthranilate isomerase [Aureitalea sp. L0-47]